MVQKKPKEEFSEKWKPTKSDAEDLRQKLAPYKQERINGKLQTKFDQYCKTVGVISFDEHGDIIVHQSNDYKHLSDIYYKLQALQWRENEDYMETHPEERKAFTESIKAMGEGLRKKYAH